MNFFKRALASMGRRPGKTVILLLLVFVLGNVISGAVSIRQAVLNTDSNLRAQLPAVAVLEVDWQAREAYGLRTGEWPDVENLTGDIIRQVGALPYVEAFNYSISTQVSSETLVRYWNPVTPEGQDWVEEDWESVRHRGADFENMELRGVSVPELFEIQTDLMELVEGRLLTEEEIQSGAQKAIISQALARENNLQAGSVIELENIVFDQERFWEEGGGDWALLHTEEFILERQPLELEVVGIVSFIAEPDNDDHRDLWQFNQQKSQLENRIVVPNALVEPQISWALDMNERHNPDAAHWREDQEGWMLTPRSIFQLENPAYLQAFAAAATEIMPNFHTVTDLSNTFSDIAGSMETMLLIANIVLWVAVGATLVILSLLITLFLRDRKYEIGIYLALGEKKSKVVTQVLLEVMSTAIVAVALSLVTGSMISSGISQQMLENDLIARQEESWQGGWSISQGDIELAMFSPGNMSMQDMLEAYDVSLDGTTIAVFFGVAMATVLVSTTAPILYVMRLNPKKIMM